ncbi:DUF4410 domain-containing protein [Rhodopila sp.]|uniref:DUF4410 domain-containing protein n=1 Tax=Rhodopila sp. TaxID=2480087 RepID=UPI003D10C07F
MLKPTLSVVGLALLLAACSTEGKVTPLLTGAAAPLPNAATWALSVQGCPQPDQCEELLTALAGHLVGAGLAARIALPGQPADLSLDVRVTRIRTVSTTARVVLGTVAGRNVVVGTDTLRDSTGAVLRAFEVEGDSAAHPFSGQTTLLDADREFATETVAALR